MIYGGLRSHLGKMILTNYSTLFSGRAVSGVSSSATQSRCDSISTAQKALQVFTVNS